MSEDTTFPAALSLKNLKSVLAATSAPLADKIAMSPTVPAATIVFSIISYS